MTTEKSAERLSDPDQPVGNDAAPRGRWGWVRSVAWGVVFLAACALGLIYRRAIAAPIARFFTQPEPQGQVLYWASPMDPSIHSGHPMQDSMGMDYVPVYAEQKPPPGPVTIDPELQERNYTTVKVESGPRVRTIEAISTVAYAEPLVGDVTLKVDAWLEQLSADYVGQSVNKGDPLFEVYAPDLVGAQGEYLKNLQFVDAARKSGSKVAIDSAEHNLASVAAKLKYLDVSQDQIDALARDKVIRKTIHYASPFAGIVVEKEAFEGRYIPAGKLLYRIADLSRVWVYVYAYPDQIHCVYDNQGATLTLTELPDRVFHGRVVYIYPYLEPKIRAVKVRLEFENPDLVLKPNMFGHVVLEPHRMGTGIRIPELAVIRTGTRELVYLALPGHHFEAREVQTGMQLDGGMIEVLSGLEGGEELVTSEDFLADSESRLRLLNRKFEPAAMQGAMPMDMPPEQPSHTHEHAH